MQVLVNIMLVGDDELGLTPDEIAAAVLEALDGDPETDRVTSNVQREGVSGVAGAPVTPPPSPPSEPPPDVPPEPEILP